MKLKELLKECLEKDQKNRMRASEVLDHASLSSFFSTPKTSEKYLNLLSRHAPRSAAIKKVDFMNKPTPEALQTYEKYQE